MSLRTLAETLRVKHYCKNAFVLLPLFFSFKFLQPIALARTALAFAAFCCTASAVYIFNDLWDRERDAQHPIKKDRPIPSGRVSLPLAVTLMVVLAVAACGAALYLSVSCLLVVAAYLLLNVAYSIRLKSIPIIDVAIIAAGFILRVLMGSLAINAPMSHWLLLTIIAVSFYLGFGKRANELKRVGAEANTREVLFKYSERFLHQAMTVMMTLAIMMYALWTIDPAVTARFGEYLVYTTALIVLLVLRYAYILDGKDAHGDPVTTLLSDKPILIGGALYVVILLLMAFL